MIPDGRIDELTRVPPEDTRAWTRGTLLRLAGADGVDDADWDWVRVSTVGRYGWREFTTIRFPDPLSCTRAANEASFEHAPDLDTVISRLIGAHPGALAAGRRDYAALSTADSRKDAP